MDQKEVYVELLNYVSGHLKVMQDKALETPKSTLDALWRYACNYTNSEKSNTNELFLPLLNESSYVFLKKLIDKRITGTPLAYLTGYETFMNINFKVDQRALIPRKETEILGYAALDLINQKAKLNDEVNVIDVCTGMGNLALAFAYHQPKTRIWAADLSEEAIKLAKENANLMELQEHVSFLSGDMFKPFMQLNLSDSIDIITCNPPYISTAKVDKMPEEISLYEPKMAFNGGYTGLQIIFRLISESMDFLKNKGWLCFEVGLGQGPGILKLLERNKHFVNLQTANNENGDIRAILAQAKK
jgi:release factor glutamine methyltransferase